MTLNKRVRIIAVFILIIPVFALLITGASFFISFTLGWKESEELSVPRFLHEPLLKVLRGEEVSKSRFAGIIMVLDQKGKIIYIAPEGQEVIDDMNWDSIDDAYAEMMEMLPGIPVNMTVYSYQNSSGLVVYVEEFFSGRKLFQTSAFVMFALYFGLIVIPVLIMSVSMQPVIRSFVSLENAAVEIGKGNLETPIRSKSKEHKGRAHAIALDSLIKAFEQMRIELKENYENQSRIMMSISHDLKTPLTLIKGYVEALKDGMAETPDEVMQYADIIFDRSMLLEERINDLIYFAKLRTSDWQARFEVFSLNNLLEESADIFINDSHIRKRSFQYNNNLPDGLNINGDRKMLFQALENLFDNACRHTKEDDIIELSAELIEDKVNILIADSGSGISEKHRQHIFEMFYRADQGRNTRGLGIGLSSAKMIVNNHGGDITYSPSKLGGAGFLIELPVISQRI
ncbi:MAG: HAMP domain-containing histidine kinase [Spirochaetales bacterium]|nr:HAMP domain-containing histidine kinase [Spirochaetales bacterium]